LSICCHSHGKADIGKAFNPDKSMADYPLDQKLWRYMSFSRFMWLLQRRSLWIGRSDTLNDPWELAINPTYLAETLARGPITPIGEERRPTNEQHAAGVYRTLALTLHGRAARRGIEDVRFVATPSGIVVVGEYARWAIYTPSVPAFWDGTDDDLWGLLRATEYDAGDTTPPLPVL
jgi:hypothetical protein